jgi:hypothetical protein
MQATVDVFMENSSSFKTESVSVEHFVGNLVCAAEGNLQNPLSTRCFIKSLLNVIRQIRPDKKVKQPSAKLQEPKWIAPPLALARPATRVQWRPWLGMLTGFLWAVPLQLFLEFQTLQFLNACP